MQRREFLTSSVVAGLAASAGASAQAQGNAAGTSTQTPAASKSVFFGQPVVSGPAPESLTILQAVNGPATGHLEIAVGDEPFRRIDSESAGLLPYDQNILKFTLPPLPPGKSVRYRVTANTILFKTDYNIIPGEPEQTEIRTFRTLDPQASATRFVVWNDTHEHQKTIDVLQQQTLAFRPDFLMWNGDQTNNVHDPVKMREQYLSPGELEISSQWPMAYARGNHDVRGPAAREVARFTGTPEDLFYYAFRSGPLAALVMDTGEDKPDDRAVYAGLAGFDAMRERQRQWLAQVIEQAWFRSAPYRILFCHIPLWWTPDGKERDFWMCSEVCRDAWLPLLQQARIQLVVSGHIHKATLMPATESQPIPQLMGGGPKLESATIIEGIADAQHCVLTCKKLTGEVAYRIELPAS